MARTKSRSSNVVRRSVYVHPVVDETTGEAQEGTGQWYHDGDEVPADVVGLITNARAFEAPEGDENEEVPGVGNYEELDKPSIKAIFEERGLEVPGGNKDELIAELRQHDAAARL